MNQTTTEGVASIDLTQLDREFKRFHQMLCERFDYTHDERDWKRDQLSLIEHIARRSLTSGSPAEPVAYLHQVVSGDGEPDQALSFAPDNFPLAGTLGYRSISHVPLSFGCSTESAAIAKKAFDAAILLASDTINAKNAEIEDLRAQLSAGAAAKAEQAPEDDTQAAVDDFVAWLQGRGALGPGALSERIFIAGWCRGKRRATAAGAGSAQPSAGGDERALFEATMGAGILADQGEFALSRAYSDGRPYTFLATIWAWKAWQARAALDQGAQAATTASASEPEAFENYFCMTLSCDGSESEELIAACRAAAHDAWMERARRAAMRANDSAAEGRQQALDQLVELGQEIGADQPLGVTDSKGAAS